MWEDRNEIENLMGRLTFSEIFKENDYFVDTYWCKNAPAPSLGTNNGYYSGYEAIEGLFKSLKELDIIRANVAKSLHPEELGNSAPEDLQGIGGINVLNLTTPVVEVSGDGQTAKGLWYLIGGSADFYTEAGAMAKSAWGRIGVDFVKEADGWKIWHLVCVHEFDVMMGTDWAKPEVPETLPEYKAVADFKLPEPNVKAQVYEYYHSRRPLKAIPAVPEPYKTFSETFSYGV